MAAWKDGSRGTLTVRRGDAERTLVGMIRSFEQDGETRWEVVIDDHAASGLPDHVVTGDKVPAYPAVGFVPEDVVSFK